VSDQKKTEPKKSDTKKKKPAPPEAKPVQAADDGWLDPSAAQEESPFGSALDLAEVDALFSSAQDGEDPDTGDDLPKGLAEPPAEEPVLEAEPMEPEPPRAPPPTVNDSSVLDDKNTFRTQAQKLAKSGDWAGLAALTSAALDVSKWATQTEIRAALLLDLARVYRDRLKDVPSAEDQFRRLVELTPGHLEANRFLGQRFKERQDWQALFQLRGNAVEATWDPNQRLEWTKEAATIARDHLRSDDQVIDAWERLWRLGDAQDEAARALSEAYRRGGHWDRLAAFLARRAEPLEGAERTTAMRELAEAYLSGVRDHEAAAKPTEEILKARANDPVALLAMGRVFARRKDWRSLTELGTRKLDDTNPAAAMDIRRLAADALATAEEWERSAEVYEKILGVDANDAEALRAKEEQLVRLGKIDGLVELLARRAEGAPEEERAKLYERAATLAEKELNDLARAAALLEKRAEIPSVRQETLQSLSVLYEGLTDTAGISRTLERLIAETINPRARIDLLRRLGDHYARGVGDDAKAERCWREILDAVPDDAAIREELTALFRRRGDFEAVDQSLTAQAWRAVDDESLATVWRAVAVNLQESSTDAGRTLRAWRRVLDVRPDDAMALRATVVQQRALNNRRELIDALEAEHRVLDDNASRIERAQEIGRLWEAENDTGAALAAYERALRLDATDKQALAAVTRLRKPAEAGAVRSALDAASAQLEGEPRAAMIRQTLGLADDQPARRFATLRRLLGITEASPTLIAELTETAGAGESHAALAAVYEEIAAAEPDAAQRADLYRRLAALYQGPLKQPVRAFLVQQTARQQPTTSLAELEPLLKLAESTGRHEDAVALLGIAAWSDAPLDVRRTAIRRRAELCEEELTDPARAFHETARLLRLDPHDAEALADVQRLAKTAELYVELDALWSELWDRAGSASERIEITRARHKLHAGALKDPMGALDQLLLAYRLEPNADVQADLEKQAKELSAWDRVLPVIEASARAKDASADQLIHLAGLHEKHRKDSARAFDLYAQALLADPGNTAIEEKLRKAGGSDKQRLTAVLRAAAARSSDPTRALGLYASAADLYEGAKRADLSLDLHQRILQLQPASRDSLEVVVAAHRSSQRWRELRDTLQRWADLDTSAKDPKRRERLLEIASLSRDKLGDVETALQTYTQILDADAEDAQALDGVRSLTSGEMEPALELKRIRIELQRASGPKRVELQLACARLQETKLDDQQGAIATLRALVAESGAVGAGYEPLNRLLQRTGAHGEQVELMEARAAALTESRPRIEVLEEAVKLAEQKGVSAEQRERLYRSLLALQPDHAEARRHLLRLYRAHGRYQDLEELLASAEARRAQDPEMAWLVTAERVRVLDRMLNRTAEAEALLNEKLKAEADHAEAVLALAALKLRQGDQAAHLALRERHAKLLPPRLAGYVLCHLAERTDETLHDTEKVLAHYRAARAVDPENRPAMEGLKAIGRRSRSWRAQAALLSDADEAKLSPAERASRLFEHASAAEEKDPAAALDLYLRGVAVNPDDPVGWDALARMHQQLGDRAQALSARRAALGAFERNSAPEPTSLSAHAGRLQQLAVAAGAAGNEKLSLAYSSKAYELAPSLASAALAVGDARLQAGATQEAYAVYSAVLAVDSLSDDERRRACFRRGVIAQRDGRLDEAITDLRAGLRIAPLDPALLEALADALVAKNRVAAGAQHYLQALVLTSEPRQRGPLYARLGRLWEHQLANADEAGVAYDLAVGSGVDQPDIMLSALQYYRRSGRKDRAAQVIDHLLPRTKAPAELATLWAERGCLLAETEEAKAMEAFDMALSYDPSCRPAVDGLAKLLEQRGEWHQLFDFLEVRIDAGTPEARAQTLRSLAMIANDHLNDPERAQLYLRAALDIRPEAGDYDRLLAMVGDDETVRREILAQRLIFSGPWISYLIEYGRQLAAAGQRRWAWCILSPLMNAMINDAALKSLVLDLRKEFDKAENVAALTPELHRRVRDRALPEPLYDVLVELDAAVPLGPRTLEEVGAARGQRLDPKLALGKTLAAIGERLGLHNVVLTRSDDLPVPYRVLQTETPHIVARTDLFAVMSAQETNALFAFMLEQSRPGARLLAGPDASQIVRALFAAVEISPSDDEIAPLVERIVKATNEGQRMMWAERLRGLTGPDGEHAKEGMMETARRVAVVAAGELRFSAKVFGRLDEAAPKMPTAGRIEDLDTFFGASPPARTAAAFAVMPGSGGFFV
jgi:hypothetical protein